jgi:hypothetical protein
LSGDVVEELLQAQVEEKVRTPEDRSALVSLYGVKDQMWPLLWA